MEGALPALYGVIEIRYKKSVDDKVVSYINAPGETHVCMDQNQI